jgi:hypothetical protein
MKTRTMGALFSMCMFGEGCIAQTEGVPEQAAAPAAAPTAADLPISPSAAPGAVSKSTGGANVCQDSCLEDWYRCGDLASSPFAECICADKLDICIRSCGLRTARPHICIPVPFESGRGLDPQSSVPDPSPEGTGSPVLNP